MRCLFCLLILSLSCILPSGASAEELRWPLDIEISPSSSFMEYRGLRFHGGVDLRTRRAVGFPVFAIADGFVSRLKIQHRGFGYALYVDHPALKLRSVFGHLDDYAEPMAAWAAKKLQKMGKRYGIDDQFGPETFPVKKGQLIAYTGETGLGPPHLHFELRTLNDEPLSPTALGYVIPDRIDPDCTGVWIEPLSHGTMINGGFLPCRIPLTKSEGNFWSWDSPIRIQGRAGLAVGVLDRAEGDNRMSAAEIRLSLDGKEVFSRLFHRYSYDENRQAAYVFDAVRSAAPGLGYVVWMFKWPFENMMLSREHSAWAGVLDESGAGKRLSISIKDFSGREAQVEGPVDVTGIPRRTTPTSDRFLAHDATTSF
ncbi:MAG TPA: M23 family metallopeptidase, partial [Candidatus Ozemobacteraceae bacterium]|nr:M23 family metallopeptidase [Candidatus Ozemobacteraceae bacterium]